MIELSLTQATALRPILPAEEPGPSSLARHALHTGQGRYWVDRWPHTQAVLCEVAGNFLLCGDPAALTPADLRPHITGVVAASPAFNDLLHQSFPHLHVWQRVIYRLAQRSALRQRTATPSGFTVRPLGVGDETALAGLSDDVSWVLKTWATPRDLVAGGYAWGAFAGEQLVSLAVTFFLGDEYEEIGVATEPAFRRKGLNSACVIGLCGAIFDRRHLPSWTTSPDNSGSRKVAEKVGFTFHGHDVLYVIGIAIP